MKFILLFISASLLVVGLLDGDQPTVTIGATLFILIQIGGLISVYRFSKGYQLPKDQNKTELSNKRNLMGTLSRYLEGIILLLGLIIMMLDGKNELFLPGAIIWIGEIVVYFLGGIIVEYITGIPLRFGYGGWQIDFRRKKK